MLIEHIMIFEHPTIKVICDTFGCPEDVEPIGFFAPLIWRITRENETRIVVYYLGEGRIEGLERQLLFKRFDKSPRGDVVPLSVDWLHAMLENAMPAKAILMMDASFVARRLPCADEDPRRIDDALARARADYQQISRDRWNRTSNIELSTTTPVHPPRLRPCRSPLRRDRTAFVHRTRPERHRPGRSGRRSGSSDRPRRARELSRRPHETCRSLSLGAPAKPARGRQREPGAGGGGRQAAWRTQSGRAGKATPARPAKGKTGRSCADRGEGRSDGWRSSAKPHLQHGAEHRDQSRHAKRDGRRLRDERRPRGERRPRDKRDLRDGHHGGACPGDDACSGGDARHGAKPEPRQGSDQRPGRRDHGWRDRGARDRLPLGRRAYGTFRLDAGDQDQG